MIWFDLAEHTRSLPVSWNRPLNSSPWSASGDSGADQDGAEVDVAPPGEAPRS
jgi:hypothetical protein